MKYEDKVAFVFNQPETCEKCVLFNYCILDLLKPTFEYKCPLIPISELKDFCYENERSAYERGYNACLYNLLRQKEYD